MDEEEGAGVSLHHDHDQDDDGAVFEDNGISIQMFAIFWQNLNQFFCEKQVNSAILNIY